MIRGHLRPGTGDDPRWHGRHFDLTGAVIDGGVLDGIDVTAGTMLDFNGATFPDGTVDFGFATFSAGTVNFSGAGG